jgi:superfamily II DNA or RNA helicase
MATGLGKTYTTVCIAKEFSRILFVCHREELIEQAYNAFNQFYPMQLGIVKEKLFEIDKKIVVASVQSLTNRLTRIDPKMFDMIVLDEAHHYMASSYIKVAYYFNPDLLLGLTATPERLDGLSLGNIFEKIVFDYGIDKGIKDGWLCELEAYRVRTDSDISKVKRTAGDYNQKELSIVIDSPERNKLIVKKHEQYAAKRQGLVFAVNIDHAIHLCQEFQRAGYNANYVVSDEDLTPDRKKVVVDFKAGRIQVLVNVMILSEGFDHCDIGVIHMARPTQSKTVYIQAIGRGTRLKTDEFLQGHQKNNCIILDYVDNTGKHSLVNTWTLDQGKCIEDMTFIGRERKERLKEKRDAVAKTIMIKQGADKKINLLKLPIIKLQTDRGGFLDPASEKQIAWLKSEGVWQEGIEYTKGQATEFITNFSAQDWMINLLKRWGYDISDGATVGQYYEAKKFQAEYTIDAVNAGFSEARKLPKSSKPFTPFKF